MRQALRKFWKRGRLRKGSQLWGLWMGQQEGRTSVVTRKTRRGRKEDSVTNWGQTTSTEITLAQTTQKRRRRSKIWMNKMEAQEKVKADWIADEWICFLTLASAKCKNLARQLRFNLEVIKNNGLICLTFVGNVVVRKQMASWCTGSGKACRNPYSTDRSGCSEVETERNIEEAYLLFREEKSRFPETISSRSLKCPWESMPSRGTADQYMWREGVNDRHLARRPVLTGTCQWATGQHSKHSDRQDPSWREIRCEPDMWPSSCGAAPYTPVEISHPWKGRGAAHPRDAHRRCPQETTACWIQEQRTSPGEGGKACTVILGNEDHAEEVRVQKASRWESVGVHSERDWGQELGTEGKRSGAGMKISFLGTLSLPDGFTPSWGESIRESS